MTRLKKTTPVSPHVTQNPNDTFNLGYFEGMIQTALIQNAHKDLVTDASYDFYGLRLATAGLDQRIKVWALDESTGQWGLGEE